MGAELARKRAGKKTKTGMSESKLSEFASKSMDAINVYLDKADIPDVKINPGERIGGPGDRIQLVPKKPKPKKNNVFVKSLDLIDTYLDLLKHGRMLPCGHPAEEGSALDKGCSVTGCDTSGASQTGKSGTVYVKQPNLGSAPGGGSMGIHATGGSGSSSGGATGSGTMTSSSPPEGGFRRSADSINLIDTYLFKHGQMLPCGHHAEGGTAIDKGCSGGCDTSSLTTPRGHTTVNIGTTLSSAPVTDSTTGKATTVGALPGASTHMGRTSFSHTATGGAVSSGGTAMEDVDDFI